MLHRLCKGENLNFYIFLVAVTSFHIKTIDPRGRPTITASGDNYFHICRPSVVQILQAQKYFEVEIMFATVITVGLAKGINNDYCFVIIYMH